MDDIFKMPPLPKNAGTTTTTTKRKLEAPSFDPTSYKSVKLDSDVDPPSNANGKDKGKGKGKAVTVQDGSDDDDDDDDGGGGGGGFAPGGDADYFAEEDEDGRFFGGGLNSVQKQVLNMMDLGDSSGDGAGGGAELTPQSVRRQVLALEKAIDENRRLRTKFPTDPTKFVDSEFTLLEAIRGLLLLSTAPALTFPILVDLNTPESLVDLLSHENSDVFVAVVEVLEEWLDPESLEDVDEDEDEAHDDGAAAADKKRDAVKALMETLVKGGLLDLAVGGLSRLNEDDEGERGGVFHALGLIENLLTLDPSMSTQPLLAPSSPFLTYLVDRLSRTKEPAEREQNRYYAAEMLALLLSLQGVGAVPGESHGVGDARARLASEGHVDTLLKVLSTYRRRDPSGADETEFMENTFDALCSALSSTGPGSRAVKTAFLQGEGIELMCLMLKEKKLARTRAIKCLDYALQGHSGRPLCESFVEALGLKTLFATFMGKSDGKKASKLSASTALTHQDTEHILSLLASLLTSLASDSPSRLRLLAKFVERDYEKVDRLVELRDEIDARVSSAGTVAQGQGLDDEEVYLEKLGEGLFALQLCDYVLAWVVMEDDGARDHTMMLLARRDRSLSQVVDVLVEYRANIGDGEDDDETALGSTSTRDEQSDDEAAEAREQAREQREILGHLIEYLKSVA